MAVGRQYDPERAQGVERSSFRRGQTGRNPTDRDQSGSKVHLLVDQGGAPLSLWITAANEHDKWSADDLIVHMVANRPYSEQHFCAHKGYDFEDVHRVVSWNYYIDHIKHKRKRNEPKEECPILGEKSFSLAAGSWNEPSVGWQNVAAVLRVGVRNHEIGSLSFTWLQPKSFLD